MQEYLVGICPRYLSGAPTPAFYKPYHQDSKKSNGQGPLHAFFAQYSPQFIYNPNKNTTAEFQRLRKMRDDALYAKFADAFAHQFNANFGTEEQSLLSWQGLCATLGIPPIPYTLKEAKQKVINTHVNLVDLTDHFYNPKIKRPIFQSLEELRDYTNSKRRYYPLDSAYAGSLLKFLLREIRSSYHGSRGKYKFQGGREGRRCR
ncbi:hypothetical protein FA15DRAFT_696103 [Coprinopsis marcescibilis]|uniref:Uncharacterized protein n=1 Tax=Coprinopsis marcescibilis TaxID=230819 RepID=A0A5C3KP78_COPMA|nr:hypothetical protein FA15DRAFT_696103 [Coprinopsis marcescibilis]